MTGFFTASSYDGSHPDHLLYQHAAPIPGINEFPSHSHFSFYDNEIVCVGPGGVKQSPDVRAVGGNGGHYIDVFDSGNLDLPWPEAIPTIFHPPLAAHPTDGDHGAHHGSVNESSWSHGSDYLTNDLGTPCDDDGSGNRNRGYIEVTDSANRTASGWLSYVRVGVLAVAWGELPCDDPDAAFYGEAFIAGLVILPTPFGGFFTVEGAAVLYTP